MTTTAPNVTDEAQIEEIISAEYENLEPHEARCLAFRRAAPKIIELLSRLSAGAIGVDPEKAAKEAEWRAMLADPVDIDVVLDINQGTTPPGMGDRNGVIEEIAVHFDDVLEHGWAQRIRSLKDSGGGLVAAVSREVSAGIQYCDLR